MAACKFFSLSELADNYAGIGKQLPTVGNPKPLTVGDFLKYLKVIDEFAKTPNALRVATILEQMASVGVLALAGRNLSTTLRQ